MGLKLKFMNTPPPHSPQTSPHFNQETSQILTNKVQDLATKGAITQVMEDGTGFISPKFLVLKSDGAWRPVINLKALNQYVVSPHFKMESIRTIKGLVKQGDWLLKLDLNDVYLTVPIHQDHQRFLRFQWQGQIWQFKVLPFG